MRIAVIAGFLAFIGSVALSFGALPMDVAFKAGTNASIDWFEINNPAVGGTITVANQPYLNTDDLNSAVVDLSRNRLMYVDDTNGISGPAYSFSLNNLLLVPNTATIVNVAPLGSWPGGLDNAGYNKTYGLVYYHVYGADEVRYLNFDTAGAISGYTTVGTLHGSGFTTSSITGGDFDFDSSGNIWITGNNVDGNHRLWSFNPTTLTVGTNVDPPREIQGMVFDSTGTTLYGYVGATGQYGIINTSTGAFQTVLTTNSNLFGDSGDLAEAIETVAVPEPGAVLMGVAAGLLFRGRVRRTSRPGAVF